MPSPEQPLSEERIAAYVRGELGADDRAAVEAAMDREPQWLAVVAMLARRDGGSRSTPERSGPSPSVPDDPHDDEALAELERDHAARLRPGASIGRYQIEHTLGTGGMGVVYAAHDPELHRSVAVKVLRGGATRDQARLVREARALARLCDPHIITIHDVGVWHGRVFLAMERVEGPTLHGWRTAAPRTWQQVVEVHVDAGRGLAAAHDAGVVHRDFKPTNVMRTDGGRVVVLDFGLADTDDDGREPSDDGETAGTSHDLSTRTGQVLGTPAYMAPEQRRGEPSGPAADQYAFCIALHEALHGRLPNTDAPPRHPPATGRWPRAIDRLIAVGLAAEPAMRHPSMRHLVDALAVCTRPSRARPIVIAAALTGLAAVGLAATIEPDAPCTGAAAVLADRVDDDRVAALVESLGAGERPYDAHTAQQVAAGLDAYRQAWIAEHTAACTASRIDGTQGDDVLDLRMRCLDRRSRSLAAVVDVLDQGDPELAVEAVRAVDALPAVAGCRDLEALRAPRSTWTDAADRDRADALLDEVAYIDALRSAARFDDAATMAADAVRRAVALGHPPTEADARLVAGWVYADRGEHAEAEAELRAALAAAQAGAHDEAITVAFSRLAWVVGYKLARHDEGRALAEHAAAWSGRLGRAAHHELPRLVALGWIEHEAGAFERSLRHFEAAMAIADGLPADDPAATHDVALALNGLGAAALGLADMPLAEASFRRAEQQLVARLGPEHPDVARVRSNLGALLRAQGQAEQARAMFEHNLVVFEASVGAEHPLVGQTLINLAVVEMDLGHDAQAERHADRAIAILGVAPGPAGTQHPMVAKAHTIRADARIGLGRASEAVDDLERALDLERESLGADHPSVAIVESNLGGAYYDLGRHDQAATHQRRALAIAEASLGASHPNVAFVLLGLGRSVYAQGRADEALALFRRAEAQADPSLRPAALLRLGEALLARGDAAGAVAALERAHALQAQVDTAEGLAGEVAFALGRARWANGDHGAARVAVSEAIEAFEAAGLVEWLAEARAWLASPQHASTLP